MIKNSFFLVLKVSLILWSHILLKQELRITLKKKKIPGRAELSPWTSICSAANSIACRWISSDSGCAPPCAGSVLQAPENQPPQDCWKPGRLFCFGLNEYLIQNIWVPSVNWAQWVKVEGEKRLLITIQGVPACGSGCGFDPWPHSVG